MTGGAVADCCMIAAEGLVSWPHRRLASVEKLHGAEVILMSGKHCERCTLVEGIVTEGSCRLHWMLARTEGE